MLLVFAGCQWMSPAGRGGRALSRAESDSIRAAMGDYASLAKNNEDLRGQVRSLELDVAKKNAEIEIEKLRCNVLGDELAAAKSDLEYVERQFVTFERQLTRKETKASAVAAIAEVQLLYEKMLQETPDLIDEKKRKEVQTKLTLADEGIKKRNYAASVYYAKRSMRILNLNERQQAALAGGGDTRIIAVSKANLRAGPGSKFDVIEQLAYGTVLVEIEHKDDWYKVRTRDGQMGWIFHTLIR